MDSKDPSEFVYPQEIAPENIHSPLALLSAAMQASCNEADSAIADIVNAVKRQVPEAAQLYQANKKGFRLVVDASDEMLEAIDRGDIKLTTDKLGNTHAQIKQANGKYGKSSLSKRKSFPKASTRCRRQTPCR